MKRISRRTAIAGILGGVTTALTGCTDGHFSILGYTTKPNYDPDIRSVYVKQFKTKVLETTPYRGMEATLTRAVISELELKTHFKVLSDPDRADTELQATIVRFQKNVVNRTPFNEAREIELVLGVELVWFDLRPGHEGKVLTNPRRRDGAIVPLEEPFDTERSLPARGPERPQPVQIIDFGRGALEVGESSASALDMAIKRVAVKIVAAMEQSWG